MALDKSRPLPLQDEAKEPLHGVIAQIQPSAPDILCLLHPTQRGQLPASSSPFSDSGLDFTDTTYVLGMWCKQVQPRWLSQEVFGIERAASLHGFPTGKRAVAVLQRWWPPAHLVSSAYDQPPPWMALNAYSVRYGLLLFPSYRKENEVPRGDMASASTLWSQSSHLFLQSPLPSSQPLVHHFELLEQPRWQLISHILSCDHFS